MRAAMPRAFFLFKPDNQLFIYKTSKNCATRKQYPKNHPCPRLARFLAQLAAEALILPLLAPVK
jgi:hypothetical protein